MTKRPRRAALPAAAFLSAVLIAAGFILSTNGAQGALIDLATRILPGLEGSPSAETSEHAAAGLTVRDFAACGPLQTGDLVFRRGFGTESRLILEAQGKSRVPYTHVGIVAAANPVTIVHAATSDDPKHPNSVVASSLSDFLALGDGAGVVRPAWNDDLKRRAARRALGMKGEAFRLVPDDPDALYCTTLIEKALSPDLKPDFPRTTVKVPVLGGNYLFPAALWEAEGMTPVCRVEKPGRAADGGAPHKASPHDCGSGNVHIGRSASFEAPANL